MEEKVLKGGIWHLHWASARKDPVFSDLLHEKECYYKLHFPFLPPKQSTAKAYDELEIPHFCGVVDRSRLHKMYLEMRKSEIPVFENTLKVIRSKSLSRSPCFSIKKTSIPKTFNDRPYKFIVNESPNSSKPPLAQIGKIPYSPTPRKSVTFQDGVRIIDISPNRNLKLYKLNLLTPNAGSQEVRRDLKVDSKVPNTLKSSKVRKQNTLSNKEKPLSEENANPIPSNNKPPLSKPSKSIEINPMVISAPHNSNDNSSKSSMLLSTLHEIQREGEECSSDNQENTSSRLDQNNIEASDRSSAQKVSFLHNFSLVERTLGGEECLEGNELCQQREVLKSDNNNLKQPDKISTRKKSQYKIKRGKKYICKCKQVRKPLKSKKSTNHFAEPSSALFHSNEMKEKEKYVTKNSIKDGISDKFIRGSRRILSEKSKESKSSLNSKDILHTTVKKSSSESFNDLNMSESFEEKSVNRSLRSNSPNEIICDLSLSIKKHNYESNSKQNKEEIAYASIFELSGEDKREDQLPPNNLNLRTHMESPVVSLLNISLPNTPPSSPNAQQIQFELISDSQPALSGENVALSPFHKSQSTLLPDKTYSDNQTLCQKLLSDNSTSFSFSNDEQSLLDLKTISFQRAQVAVPSESKQSPEALDALPCESQAQLANEIPKIDETPSFSVHMLTKITNPNNTNLNYLRESRIAHIRDTDESSLEPHHYSDDSFHDNQSEVDSPVKYNSENLSFLNKVTAHLTINDNDLPPSKEEACLEILDEVGKKTHLYAKENHQTESVLRKDNNLGTRSSVASFSISLENSISERTDLANISESKQKYEEDVMLDNIHNDVDRTSLENDSSSESIIFSPSDIELISGNRESLEEVSTAYETEKETGKLKISRYIRKDLKLCQIQDQNRHESVLADKQKPSNYKSVNVSPVTGFEQLNESSNINRFKSTVVNLVDGGINEFSNDSFLKSSIANLSVGNINEFNDVDLEDDGGYREDAYSTNFDCSEDRAGTLAQKLPNKISPIKERAISNLSVDENDKIAGKNPQKGDNSILIGYAETPCKLKDLRSALSEQILIELPEEIHNKNHLGKQVQITQKENAQDKENVSCKTNIEDFVLNSKLDFENHEKPINISSEKNSIDKSNNETGISKHFLDVNIKSLPCTNTELDSNSGLNLLAKDKIKFNSFEHNDTAKSESIISNSFSEGTKISGKCREINLNWTFPHSSIASVLHNLVEVKTSQNYKDDNNRSEPSIDSNKQKSSVSIIDDSNSPTNYKSSPVLDRLFKLNEMTMSKQGENISIKCNEINKNLKSTEYENMSQDKKKYSSAIRSNILDHSRSSLSKELKIGVNETLNMVKCPEIEEHYMQEKNSKPYVTEETRIKAEIKSSSSDMQEDSSPVNNSLSSPFILSSEVMNHKKRKNHFIRKKRAKLLKSDPSIIYKILSSSEEERRSTKKPPKPWRRYSAQLNFQSGLISPDSEWEMSQIEQPEISEIKESIVQDKLLESESFPKIEPIHSLKQPIEDLQKTFFVDLPQKFEVPSETLAAKKISDLEDSKTSENILFNASDNQNRLKFIKNKSRILASEIFSSEENKNSSQTTNTGEGSQIGHKNNSEDGAINTYKASENKNFKQEKSPGVLWCKSTSMKEALKFEKWYRSQWGGESNCAKPNYNSDINNENLAANPPTGNPNKSNESLKKKMRDISFHSSSKVYQSEEKSENDLSKYFHTNYEDTQSHGTSKESNSSPENCREVKHTKRQPLSEISNSQEIFVEKKNKLNENTECIMADCTNLHSARPSSEDTFKKSHIVFKNMNSPTFSETTFYEKNETVPAKIKPEVNKYNEKELKYSSPKKIIANQNFERSVRKRGSTSPSSYKFKPEAVEDGHDLKKESTIQMEETYRPERKKYVKSSIVRWMDVSACESTRASSNSPEIETLLRRTFFMGDQK